VSFNTTQASYQALRSILVERTNPVVAWIGSGMSRPADLPSWGKLRDALVAECRAVASRAEHGKEGQRLASAADYASTLDDLWVAFEILRDALGKTTYCATLREQLSPAITCDIPEGYSILWGLPIAGILNLNIDRLATRAYSLVHGGQAVNEFHSTQIPKLMHVLKEPTPFIANLHGISSDESTWIFTRTELNALLKHHAYKQFIKTCLLAKTVVFLGIMANDVAVASHLQALRKVGIDFGAHFWVTHRADDITRRWAEEAGVRIITYSASDDSHEELGEMLRDIASFLPQEVDAEPVTAIEPTVGDKLPDPTKIRLWEPEAIRQALNRHAAAILAKNDQEAYRAYEEFCEEYSLALAIAWHATTRKPYNELFGYKLVDEIAGGAFARVFRAEDKTGRPLVVKLLKQDMHRKREMLQSFRRGVRSMKILERRNVAGMVPYQMASEIPTFVAMDFVDGPDLRKAVRGSLLSDWADVLHIAYSLAVIIRTAHQLPERVLHRDIRPSNVMLEGFYSSPDSWRVVVLDFDLSWHLGACEESVQRHETFTGYLAPEQVESIAQVSTRSALVDSYGLGMTLYFLRTGRDPKYLEPKHAGWRSTLRDSVCSWGCPSWVSLPRRFARLIGCSTLHVQARRWDMSRIVDELERLRNAHRDAKLVESASLWAEEIAARAAEELSASQYTWDVDSACAEIQFGTGIDFRVIGNEIQREVEVQISWTSDGTHRYASVKKYLPAKCQRALEGLQKGGWRKHGRQHVAVDGARCCVSRSVLSLQSDPLTASQSVAKAIQEMMFSTRE